MQWSATRWHNSVICVCILIAPAKLSLPRPWIYCVGQFGLHIISDASKLFIFQEYLSLIQNYHIKDKVLLRLVKTSGLPFDFQLYAAPAGLKMQIKKWFNHAGEQDLQINFTTLQ